MLCYKDMTFCSYWEECKDGKNCNRALTPEVFENATKWWGLISKNPVPICQFSEQPDCFKENKD